jgi:hypothetical protein
MALAYIITLEKELPESAAAAKIGAALARETDRLDLAARSAKVPAITELLSENQSALIQQMKDEGMDPTRMRLPPEQWYDAGEGLKTVRGLIEYVNANLNNFKLPNPILKALKSHEATLVAAQKAGVKFHFTKADL